MVHRTKTGEEIELCDMSLSHLKNMMAMLERMAAKGIVVQSGGSYWAGDNWYDEEHLNGKEALEHLGYYEYKDELARRESIK